MSTLSPPIAALVTHLRLDELRRSGESPIWREMRYDEYPGLAVPPPCWAAIEACANGLEIGTGLNLLLHSPAILALDEETRWGLYHCLHRSWLLIERGAGGAEVIVTTVHARKLLGYRARILRLGDEPEQESEETFSGGDDGT